MENSIRLLEEPFIPKDEIIRKGTNRYKEKIIFIQIFFIFTFLFDYLFGQIISDFSFSIQESLDKTKNCHLLRILGKTGTYQAKIFIFIIILNLKDLYSASVYVYLMSLSVWLNGNLKLIYRDSRPYWLADTITPCSCVVNYGSPSTHALNAIVVYLIVWECLCTRRIRKLYPIYSLIILFLCLFLAIFNGLIQFFKNVHSIDQLILGYMIGFGFYYIFFYIIEIDLDNPKEFKKYFKNDRIKLKFIFGNIALFFIHVVIHISMDIPINNQWKEGMLRFCQPFILFNWFDYESYLKACQLFLPLGVYLGCLIEQSWLFDSETGIYFKFNFCEDKRWNKTDHFKTAIRLLLMILGYFPFSSLFLFGSPENPLWMYLLFGFIIPDFLGGIYILLISRTLCRLLLLTNESHKK